MANKSYVVWNNKGGVGKSTIVFHVATVYAQKNPDRDIVVIDMCPQGNSSMMLLGGAKKGETELNKLLSLATPKTVVGYITDVLTTQSSPVVANNYLTKLDVINNNMTDNIYLMSGDGNLELVAPLISERANARPISQSDKPWEKAHSIIKNFTNSHINEGRDCTFFIDTNPAFSIYTEIAVLAGEFLLVPINADDSSIFAIKGLFNLIYGNQTKHPVYGNYTFASIVDGNGMKRPIIHSLLGNRFTQKKGAAHAFKALSIEATKKMYDEFLANPNRFRKPSSVINSQDDFEKEFTIELRDFNSAGVVAANSGLPLNSMDRHKYQVYGEDIQVSKEQREACKKTIESLVAAI